MTIQMNATEFHSVKLDLDEAAWRKRISRTAFMRESLNRNIAYYLDVESKGSVRERLVDDSVVKTTPATALPLPGR
jgi:hypothetical protein